MLFLPFTTEYLKLSIASGSIVGGSMLMCLFYVRVLIQRRVNMQDKLKFGMLYSKYVIASSSSTHDFFLLILLFKEVRGIRFKRLRLMS